MFLPSTFVARLRSPSRGEGRVSRTVKWVGWWDQHHTLCQNQHGKKETCENKYYMGGQLGD